MSKQDRLILIYKGVSDFYEECNLKIYWVNFDQIILDMFLIMLQET